MHTLKLKIKDGIYDKVLFILNKFDKSKLEIITEDKDFNDNKRYLESQLKEITSGKSTIIGMEDLNARLERIIVEFEDSESRDQNIQ
jgi:tRNA 2-selenouridine synthase SelU